MENNEQIDIETLKQQQEAHKSEIETKRAEERKKLGEKQN